jgi:hypothetical protein
VYLCIHELVYVCVCVCESEYLPTCSGIFVPWGRYRATEQVQWYIEDLESLDIFDQKVHGWLELDYNL